MSLEGGNAMNSALILGPFGMIVVGILTIVYWRRKSRAGFRYFLMGGVIWMVAIAPKVVMDLTITNSLSSWFYSSLGLEWMLVAIGAYVGIRTGLFECGFTYLGFRGTRLKEASLDEATAFGVGFGATEAIIIAIPSLIQLALFILNPALLDLLTPAQRLALEAQLNMSTWTVPAPIIERLFTIFVHTFTALLVFISVVKGRPSFFIIAFLFKTILDGLIPYLQWALQPYTSLMGLYLIEGFVVVMGLISLWGIIRIRKGYK
jgi:uncharacterized membrane protein YhfC